MVDQPCNKESCVPPCQTGFHGSNCNEDVNECARANPCGLHGNCTNIQGGFKCSCPQGYTGEFCEVSPHDTTEEDLRGQLTVQLVLIFLFLFLLSVLLLVAMSLFTSFKKKRRNLAAQNAASPPRDPSQDAEAGADLDTTQMQASADDPQQQADEHSNETLRLTGAPTTEMTLHLTSSSSSSLADDSTW